MRIVELDRLWPTTTYGKSVDQLLLLACCRWAKDGYMGDMACVHAQMYMLRMDAHTYIHTYKLLLRAPSWDGMVGAAR